MRPSGRTPTQMRDVTLTRRYTRYAEVTGEQDCSRHRDVRCHMHRTHNEFAHTVRRVKGQLLWSQVKIKTAILNRTVDVNG